MTDRLNSQDGKPAKVVRGKDDWPDPFAGRQLNTMTADDWCQRGNAYLTHIGRAHELHWVVRNKQPTIEHRHISPSER
jgi:hypothetical protein